MRISRERFEELAFEIAAAVLAELPPDLRAEAETVILEIEDRADPEQLPGEGRTLLGLYQGVPLVERLADSMLLQPDRITLFQGPLQSLACVYLVGGSCELPLLSRSLKEKFGKRVRRSPFPSAATAIGLAISADQRSGYTLQDRFSRHFGVWRESNFGKEMIFDPIFTKETPLPSREKPLVVHRTYHPVHNIGHYRFIECGQMGGH